VASSARLQEIATRALELSSDERDAFLASTCGHDPQLRAEVELLLGNSDSPPDLSDGTNTIDGGSSDRRPADFSRQIGPYTLMDRVGEGGMGTVYRAEQHEPIRRTVAVKVIRGEFSSSSVIARFAAERQALAGMDHPNIAKILDAGTHAGLPFFVMELVPGAPITRFCDQQMMSIRDRLELFIQVCEAIAHAHTKAILHRDIKSSNVMAYLVDGKPHAKVIDFGIAKALTDDRLSDHLARTQVGRAVGTYETMSPEQAEGIADIDTRTDVYALGVLLYELLCGFKPFAGKMVPGINEVEVHRIIREVNPPSPSTRISGEVAKVRQSGQSELVKRLRTELEWIPLKACRKERERRYDSVSQLVDDVRNYLEGRPLLAGPDSRVYRLKKFTRRNKGAITAASSVLMALLLGITGTTVGMVRETRQRHAAELAKIEADQQRDNANAVVSFLTDDVIQRASPARTFDKNVRDVLVNSLLIPADENVHKRFAGKPLVEAAILDMLALTFKDLGRADLALPRAKSAYELRLAALGPDHLDTIGTLDDYAMMLQCTGKAADAEPLFKKTLAQSLARFGENSGVTVQLLNNYGEDLKDLGRLNEAEPFLVRAVAAGRRIYGNDNPKTLDLIDNHAALLLMLGRGSDALSLFQEAWTTSRRTLGDDADATVEYLDHYSGTLAQQGHPVEAEPLSRQAWERRTNSLGEDQPATIDALNSYAVILQKLGRSKDALPLAEKAWKVRQAALGDDAAETRNSLNNYAHVLASLRNTALAADCFRQLYERDLRIDGDDSASTLQASRNYAEQLAVLGRWGDAKPLFEQLWHEDQKLLPPDNPETITACMRYATALFNTNKIEDAERLCRDATESAANNKAMGPADSRTKVFASNLASCLDRLNRQDDAKAIRDRFGLSLAPALNNR